jgi:hypothetical protein
LATLNKWIIQLGDEKLKVRQRAYNSIKKWLKQAPKYIDVWNEIRKRYVSEADFERHQRLGKLRQIGPSNDAVAKALWFPIIVKLGDNKYKVRRDARKRLKDDIEIGGDVKKKLKKLLGSKEVAKLGEKDKEIRQSVDFLLKIP